MKSFQLAYVTAVIAILLAVTLLPTTDAECCRPFHPGICYDCSRISTFLEYCAAGPGGCNIFGCNCDGGCRRPKPGETGCFPGNRMNKPKPSPAEVREQELNMKAYQEQLRMDAILKAKEAGAK